MAEVAKTVGVILAGGTGSRVGLSIPKQLIKVAGQPVMEHTIGIFEAAESVDEIYLLMHPDHLEAAKQIAKRHAKVTKVLAGGRTRSDSTQAALDALADLPADTKVLFHDAVRPLLETRIIDDCVVALDSFDAVDVAIPSADTIIAVDQQNRISSIPERSKLRRGQTPQAFRLGTIIEAYRLAWEDPSFVATDDCGVVHRYLPDVPIVVVAGADQNMKITEPIDVFIADKLFQIGSTLASAQVDPSSYAERLADKVVVILGGSYGIGHDIADMAKGFGAKVYTYSRTQTGTHAENPAEVEAALADAHAKAGRIDYLIVTAGVLNRGRLDEASMEEIAAGIQVNYLSPVIAARAGLKYLRESKGQLIFFTSSSYTRGRADYSIYSSTKAAVVNLAQALADEWSADQVRVNVINPERTGTPMRTKAFGAEPPGTLLSSKVVALTTIDVMLSELTGQVIDVRRVEPGQTGLSRNENEVSRIAAWLSDSESEWEPGN